MSVEQTINHLLSLDKYHAYFSILKGIRNGIFYGTKIRFPHALVMTFLFRDGTLREKFTYIIRATIQHATNLAKFSFLYKLMRYTMAKLNGGKQKDLNLAHNMPLWHVPVAAGVAGLCVFGKNNPINMQINMYLLSRVIFGSVRLLSDNGYLPSRHSDKGGRDYFPFFACGVWAMALWLFEFHKHTLQGSLQASMTYLHHDSNVWHNIWDFLVYNKMP